MSFSPQIAAVAGSEFTSGSATHNVSMPAGIGAGELLLAIIVYLSPTEVSTNTPSGWTLLRSAGVAPPSVTTAMRVHVYGKVAAGTETTTNFSTVQSDVVGAAQALRVNRWPGGLSNVSIAASGVTQTPGVGIAPAALSVPWGNKSHLWLNILGHANDGAVADISAVPVGYELLLHTQASTGSLRAGVATAFRSRVATSESPPSFTLSASNDLLALSGAVQSVFTVEGGRARDRLIAEIDGIEYEVDTPEQLRELQAKAHEAEVERAQLRRLERVAEELAERRHLERAAQLRMDRAIERQVMHKINAERELKAAQDKLNAELAERLVIQPDRVRFTEPKSTVGLTSSTGLRRLGRKQ